MTEIQSLTNPESWRHCDGKHNPADLPTRGQIVQNLIDSQLWRIGPTSFMVATESQVSDKPSVNDKVNTELRTRFEVVVEFTSTEPAELLLDLTKYSRLKTVLRITVWVQRFIANAHVVFTHKG